jgi:solute carrier family 35 protein
MSEYAVTLAVGLAYFSASSMMLLVNKLVVTFIPAPVTVTTIQYITAVVFVALGAKVCKCVEADITIKWDVVKHYIAIPFLFSVAIFSNMKVLQGANVETFMVFRFSTPVSVALVDFALMGRTLPSLRTWLSFILIVSGAVWYTITDEGFSISTVGQSLLT